MIIFYKQKIFVNISAEYMEKLSIEKNKFDDMQWIISSLDLFIFASILFRIIFENFPMPWIIMEQWIFDW